MVITGGLCGVISAVIILGMGLDSFVLKVVCFLIHFLCLPSHGVSVNAL